MRQEPVIPKQVVDLLIKAAREAAGQAYCPYSGYPVGAAALTSDGQIFTGCNVENASSGLTVCAERTAMFKAVSSGCRELAAIAVTGGTSRDPAMPCGACRQVMAEFVRDGLQIFVAGLTGRRVTAVTLGELLPKAFRLDSKKNK
ncbi:MAG: cytidine deaminase [Kiritimatiellae bacterium]|nr:cytidine deaminase [Kiritimatiellia bacterium]